MFRLARNSEGYNLATAIVLTDTNVMEVLKNQNQWLNMHYPMFERKLQAVSKLNGKYYDQITILTLDGQEKNIYFDVTRCVESPS